MRNMTAATVEDVQAIVLNSAHVQAHGALTKSAVRQPGEQATQLDLRGLTGIVEYEPGEYTFTARAGTALREVEAALAQHQQFLPFDPPLVSAGATLGGTVAAGLSGAGRYRYGGVRDFLIGVRFVDGQGRLVRGGGKVVKNAAGFDLPKLMVGSLGQFGVLTEVSFKVFPQPEAYATLQVAYNNVQTALAGLQKVVDAHFDVYALDLVVAQTSGPAPSYQLLVRLGGAPTLLRQRIDQLRGVMGETARSGELLSEMADTELWTAAREFTWAPPNAALVKVATTIRTLDKLEAALQDQGAVRRYAVGGNLLWLAWPASLSTLDALLAKHGVGGVVVRGQADNPLLGQQQGQAFARRIKQALDPQQRFPNFF